MGFCRFTGLGLILGLALLASACTNATLPGIWPSYADDGSEAYEDANADGPPTVRKLACAIDHLEKHIDRYGSIVPQHASVWGQARLMMHRQEFEREMRKDLTAFGPSIQALISTSDQAYLANAFALQAALGTAGAAAGGVDVTKLVSSPTDVIQREKLIGQMNIGNLVLPNGKLAIEPTLLEDQKKRFLDHLHALRRVNEGDDNTDAPGYGLYLVRLPISVLTGCCTQTGYGGECTFTATPHLPDDLLPHTFRDLVINDLAGLLTLPLTRVLETVPEEEMKRLLVEYEKVSEGRALIRSGLPPKGRQVHQQVRLMLPVREAGADVAYERVSNAIYTALSRVFSNTMPTSPRHLNQSPVPASQIVTTFGAHNLAYLAHQLRRTIKDHLACHNTPYHLDVQASLKNELVAAYDLLVSPKAQQLWRHCTPILAEAIRTQDLNTLIAIQEEFFHVDVEGLSDTYFIEAPFKGDPGIKVIRSLTSILAWAIVIDSALLNQRFHEEMRAAHAAKGCPCPPDAWLPLFLPHPPPEVCQIFNDFVRCRWPLYIFALDPETEDQNVGDAFSLRRELQLAMSLAFTNGQISARNFTQYVRRIEKDIETIAINRTIVGFSHGDNTFGWRFYPRVQTPPVAGNFETIFRDLLLGGYGPGRELRHRRLENGIRECNALVIMPSFVPYMDLEVTGTWFRLACPKCKTLDMRDTMRLSRQVKRIQDHTQFVCDAERYRPGDVGLMVRRLDQLSQRLPLQYQLVSVPYENTHGGFELLSAGVTDLAPVLVGWYGAPGINPNGETAVFLVGDNFSVHQTRVIVGGRWLDPNCPIDCTGPGTSADCKCQSQTSAKPAPPHNLTIRAVAADDDEATAQAADPDQEGVQPAGFRGTAQPRSRPVRAPGVTVVTVPAAVAGVTPRPTVAEAKAAVADAKANLAEARAAVADTQAKTAAAKAAVAGTPDAKAAADDAKAAAQNATVAAKESTVTAKEATVAAKEAKVAAVTPPPAAPEVGHYQVELLSRQVMRVVIPRGVYSKDGFLDVHVATPYGVSPHLHIPILCSDKKPEIAPVGYVLPADQNTIHVNYYMEASKSAPASGGWALKLATPFPKDEVRITWSDPLGSALKVVDVVFAFDVGGTKLSVPLRGLTASNGYYKIDGPRVAELAGSLLVQLEGLGIYTAGNPLPAALQTKTVTVTPVSPPYPMQQAALVAGAVLRGAVFSRGSYLPFFDLVLLDSSLRPPTHAVQGVQAHNQLQIQFHQVSPPPANP
jgi:hypothetical protein